MSEYDAQKPQLGGVRPLECDSHHPIIAGVCGLLWSTGFDSLHVGCTSYGVGAADCLDNNCKLVLKKDPNCIAKAIDWYKNNTWDYREELISYVKKYNWKNIRECYINTWRGMLES